MVAQYLKEIGKIRQKHIFSCPLIEEDGGFGELVGEYARLLVIMPDEPRDSPLRKRINEVRDDLKHKVVMYNRSTM